MAVCPDCRGWTSDETGRYPCERCDDTGYLSDDEWDGEGRCPECQGWDCDPEGGCWHDDGDPE